MNAITKWLFGLLFVSGVALAGQVANNQVDVAELKTDIKYIREGIKELKIMVRERQ